MIHSLRIQLDQTEASANHVSIKVAVRGVGGFGLLVQTVVSRKCVHLCLATITKMYNYIIRVVTLSRKHDNHELYKFIQLYCIQSRWSSCK